VLLTGGRGANTPWQVKLKNRPHLAYTSVFSRLLAFSRLLFYSVIRKVLGVFSDDSDFSIAIHIGIRYQFFHFFWVLASGPPTIARALPSAKFYAQTSSSATGHIALTMGFSDLCKHCYRFTHASFHKVYMYAHGWRNIFQSGVGAQVHVENILQQIFWFELATVKSQALEYDVTAYTPYQGPNRLFLNVGPQAHKRACGFLKRVWSIHCAYSGPQGICMAEIPNFIC